jgi:hypothetical protein
MIYSNMVIFCDELHYKSTERYMTYKNTTGLKQYSYAMFCKKHYLNNSLKPNISTSFTSK